MYPYGVKKVHMKHTSYVTLILIAPGMFHDASRVINTIDIDRGHEHAFRIRYLLNFKKLINIKSISYDIYEKINTSNAPCNKSINWSEDTCKMRKVFHYALCEQNTIY